MALKQRIQDDLKAALLGGNRFAAETLRGLKAAILNEEVAKGKRDEGLEDVEIEQIIAKEVKKRNESAALYEQNDRAESASNERQEAEILSTYLPPQLGEEEITSMIEAAITQLGANGMSDMGKVIGAVKANVGNTADGAIIAKLVKEQLTK
jgi:uncharacterized protein